MLAIYILIGHSPVVTHSSIEYLGHLGEFLEGIAASLTFLGLIVAGVVGYFKYRQQLRLGAANLLLTMEPEHRRLLRTCLDIELLKENDELDQLLTRSNKGDTKPEDRETLQKVDRCLRFFYTCTVLDHLGVEEIAIVRAYYWYLLQLTDTNKQQLQIYLYANYPRLFEWLSCNRSFLEKFGATGKWKPTPWERFMAILNSEGWV